MLKYTTETVTRINDGDFDQAANQFLKQRNIKWENMPANGYYNPVVQNEWSNDTSYKFAVKPEESEQNITLDWCPSAAQILNWMCCDGLVPEGKCYINVCW